MSCPRVSIIILNWNGVEDTIECLESLKRIAYPNYEVIIVDNASSGDDVKILKEKYLDYIYVIANDRNYGFPEGCNIGMRYALDKGTDQLLLLNNDTIVDPEFLTELVAVAESEPTIGIVGSKVYFYHRPDHIQAAGGKIIWWLGYIDVYGIGQEDRGQFNDVAERDYVYGTSLLLKRAVVEQISFMDPYFFFDVEEYDYCTKAKRAGFKVMYAPRSRVWHKAGASRAKVTEYPATRVLLEQKAGFGKSKYYYRLFRAYCPPGLFLLPFLLHVSMAMPLLLLIRRGEWRVILKGTRRRLRFLGVRVSNKLHLPH